MHLMHTIIAALVRPPGLCSPFNLLVGVALSDVLAPNNGNLCGVKGAHRAVLPLRPPSRDYDPWVLRRGTYL
jgi:hypothetical protein